MKLSPSETIAVRPAPGRASALVAVANVITAAAAAVAQTVPLMISPRCPLLELGGDQPDQRDDHAAAYLHHRVLEAIHPVVDPLQLGIDPIEAHIDLVELPVDLLEPLVNLLEPFVDLLEPPIDLLEPPIDLLELFVDLLEALVDQPEPIVNPMV
jgi:hypothetical protein